MTQTDQFFPYIRYNKNDSFQEWGQKHGEEFRKGIQELVEIRKHLMLQKNPKLKDKLNSLAHEQFEVSKNFAREIAEEIQGIAQGANLSLEDIVILNNYTDFRDIQLPDEGCSTIHIQRNEESFSGQTWDMHASAKNYVCLIHVPQKDPQFETLCFSLVGCVGMMGINSKGLLLGVNNINTQNARVGLIWPILVRKVLTNSSFQEARDLLVKSPVTSGHNYLLGSRIQGEHLEITPEIFESVAYIQEPQNGEIFHTNHCLGHNIQKLEDASSLSSTTHNRYEILKKKTSSVKNFSDFISLLKNHEEYPKSICSHFESNVQDPSMTCGGGAVHFYQNKMNIHFYRGCPTYDSNYKDYNFVINENGEFHQEK